MLMSMIRYGGVYGNERIKRCKCEVLKFADRAGGLRGCRRQPCDRLQLLLYVPENRRLGLPVVEGVTQLRKLVHEEVRDLVIRDHVAEQPWNLMKR